jgi:N4-gp56 family major capsid protein
MANDTSTSLQLAPEIKQYYDLVLLERAKPNLLHLQFGQRRPLPQNGGKSVEFRRFNSLPEATTPLVEGTPSNQQNMSISTVVASVSQYGAYVQFTDFLVVTALDDYLSETAEVLGEQAGSSIDLVVRNIITSGTNVYYQGGVGSRGAITASSILGASTLRRSMRNLKRANARPFPELNGNYAWVFHPDGEYDLLGDSTITTAFQRGAPRGFDDQPELIGYIGQYMSFSMFESTNARIYPSQGATGADVYCALAIGKDAYGVTEIDSSGLQTYFQQLGSAGANDPLHQFGTIGWKVNMTAEILNNSWLLRVEHGATP